MEKLERKRWIPPARLDVFGFFYDRYIGDTGRKIFLASVRMSNRRRLKKVKFTIPKHFEKS